VWTLAGTLAARPARAGARARPRSRAGTASHQAGRGRDSAHRRRVSWSAGLAGD